MVYVPRRVGETFEAFMSRTLEINELTEKCGALAEQMKGLDENDFPHLVSRKKQYEVRIKELMTLQQANSNAFICK